MARLEDQDRMCPGQGTVVLWEDAGENSIDHWSALMGERPEGIRRKRIKCPECGRRVKSSVRYCGDGCCIGHVLPPHKKKGWWK